MGRNCVLASFQSLSASVALTLIGGCSGGSDVAPSPASAQRLTHSATGRILSVQDPMGMINIHSGMARHFKSFYMCPVNGSIEYVSDFNNNVIDIYAGKFAGQSACGQIASPLLSNPSGVHVTSDSHDLYVANRSGSNILVFHRGQTTPFNTYTDPFIQYPNDVTVAKDKTVIASNIMGWSRGGEAGSISTWIEGSNGGAFVGNFPMPNSAEGEFVTVKRNSTVYYSALFPTPELWSVSCPAGACGAQTQVPGVSFVTPGGMAVDATGDLLAVDLYTQEAETFELPNPNPSTFPLVPPVGMAINERDRHLFVADYELAAEYLYPSGKLVGTVPASNAGSSLFGIAVDP